VRRGLSVRPMSGRDAESRDPVYVEAAFGAVEGEVLELALEVGLHLQELQAEHLGVDGDSMISSTGSLRLVHELVGLDRLLGDGVHSLLEDLALLVGHSRMLRGREDMEQLGAGSRTEGTEALSSLRSRVGTHRLSPSNRPTQRDEQKQGEPDADGIGGPVGKLGVSVDQAALGYLDQSAGSQCAQRNWNR
jgi:hypothetical protein